MEYKFEIGEYVYIKPTLIEYATDDCREAFIRLSTTGIFRVFEYDGGIINNTGEILYNIENTEMNIEAKFEFNCGLTESVLQYLNYGFSEDLLESVKCYENNDEVIVKDINSIYNAIPDPTIALDYTYWSDAYSKYVGHTFKIRRNYESEECKYNRHYYTLYSDDPDLNVLLECLYFPGRSLQLVDSTYRIDMDGFKTNDNNWKNGLKWF